MLDGMTVGRVQLPDGPIYVAEDSDEPMQAPEWASYLSIVDGTLNLVPLCDLDQPMLKEVMAENCGLVSYIPTSTYFTQRVHIKCRGRPTLSGCSMGMPCTRCKVWYVGKYSNPSFGPFSQVFCSIPGFFVFL